ncbi:MAG: beta-galactosidase [Anaerolineae bacterium]
MRFVLRRWWAWVFAAGVVLLLMGLLLGLPGRVAADDEPKGGVTAAGDAGAQAVPPSGHPGIYLAGDSENYDPIVYHLDGGMRAYYWAQLEPTKGNYRWDLVDDWLAAEAASGKKAAITFSTYNGRRAGGIAVPSWVWAEAPNAVVNIACDYPDDRGCPADGVLRIPKYWDPAYRNRYATFVNAFAARYRTDPRVAWIGIGMGLYGETKPADSRMCVRWDVDLNCIKYADDIESIRLQGLDSLGWVGAVNAVTDIYLNAFSVGGVLQKPLLLQSAPFFLASWERPLFRKYAVDRGVGLSLNGFHADWNNATYTCPHVPGDPIRTCPGTGPDACKTDPNSCAGYFDQVIHYSHTVPIALESYEYMLPDAVRLYWGLINGLDKHVDYFRLSYDLFMYTADDEAHGGPPAGTPIADNIYQIEWARKWVGKTKETTPSVWVVMREHREPYQGDSWCPQVGNYSFWLYQNDNVPGGQTVPEIGQLNSCTDPGNTTVPCTYPTVNTTLGFYKESWVTRRTDQGTGNRYMWFNVDNGYIYGGTNAISITVTYFDYGYDTWDLTYDSISGAKKATPLGSAVDYVQKTNTQTWKKAYFVINDARFNDSLYGNPSVYPTDFRIDCRADGNEWVHMVEVAKREAASSVPISLHYGWNLISLPVEPATSYTALSLLNEINAQGGSAVEVDRWMADVGDWGPYILGGPYPNYSIELGKGYFVKCNAPSTWNVAGQVVYTPVPLSFTPGWNLIAIPSSDAYTAWSLFDAINGQGGSAVEIDRWLNGGWDFTLNSPRFNNFAIEKGKAYFVKCTGSSSFTP